MPQLDGEKVANTLETIVASGVEPSHMHLWYLIHAPEISQTYFFLIRALAVILKN